MSDASTSDYSRADPDSNLDGWIEESGRSMFASQLREEELLRRQIALLEKESPLRDELVDAAIAAADRSGIGSDRVWELARQIKAMREAR